MPDSPLPYRRPERGYRVRRTFGFVDLSGFTHYSVVEGDDRAVEQLSMFRAAVRSVGSATGVRVAKWLGDGAMLVGLDSASLVGAVIEIMSVMRENGTALGLHAGVAEGDVILFEGDDHIGRVVNLAARLTDLARPWQILGPVELLHGLDRSPAALGPHDIAGFDDPVDLADLALVPALVESLNL